MMDASSEPVDFRLLHRLTRRGVRLVRAGSGFRLLAGSARAPSDPVDQHLLNDLKARGLLVDDESGALSLTQAGRMFVRRRLAGNDGFAAQHQTRGLLKPSDDQGRDRAITINLDESPLASLRRRRSDGRPLIDAAELAAGERFRADYSRAQLMPRVSANWSATVARNRRDGGASGRANLSDVALDARRRVERALAAVGPDFGGVLVDFCCFLTGMEEIERNRRWPARSAKLVLRLALASLARHYGLSASADGPSRTRMRHWGSGDYRPSLE